MSDPSTSHIPQEKVGPAAESPRGSLNSVSPSFSGGTVFSVAHGHNEEERLLQQHLTAVKIHSSRMKVALDGGKLMESLKHCSSMLNELRANSLYPKSYNVLCRS